MPDETQVGDDNLASTETPAKPARKTAAKKAASKKTTARKAPAKKAAAAPAASEAPEPAVDPDPPAEAGAAAGAAKKAPARKAPAKKAPAKKTAAKTAEKKAPAKKAAAKAIEEPVEADEQTDAPEAPAVLFQVPEQTKVPARRTRKSAAAEQPADETAAADESAEETSAKAPAKKAAAKRTTAKKAAAETAETSPATKGTAKKSTAKKSTAKKSAATAAVDAAEDELTEEALAAAAVAEEPELTPVLAADEGAGADEDDDSDDSDDSGSDESNAPRRRRRRGGRRRRRSGGGSEGHGDDDSGDEDSTDQQRGDDEQPESGSGEESSGENGGSSSSRRRRRRRRAGEEEPDSSDDPTNTVTRVRSKRSVEDEITAVAGSTRLEAKKQRRREGREAGRRRAPIVSEAEFLARREAVDRVMVVRQREQLTQIGVLEDRVLVEHYVARESQTSLIGNVYLGRVQNVLPSMEAAFIDIGKGRNAVLYAGEVNWSALGHKDGQPRKIESVLSSGQTVLVQVTKDPIGHKGARLTSQVSLAGRFLVYVPDGTTSGISRKLPDTERHRLKALLKEIVPDSAGVIVRTAAEGASEDELTRDVERLKVRWEEIEAKAANKAAGAQLLYGEPDLTLKVVRDLFTEDFTKLVIQGDDAWETVQSYVAQVAPDLEGRLERYDPGPDGKGGKADVFAEYRIDEQIAKGLDRKVWLPSGGSLVIDRTEAMTVIDVNTGKFTGSGGNLEETVTKNNLEAAEEVVRQLRLRDIGGIIVVDFIDMVLESNRDLVLRRLVECLGRDRTRHQVAEVTSLGLVQMTRKRIGTGLLEVFGENCEHCHGRGVVVHDHPVEPKRGGDDDSKSGGRRGGRRGRGQDGDSGSSSQASRGSQKAPSPKDVAAMARPESTESEPAESEATEAEATEADQPSQANRKKSKAAAAETAPAEVTPAETTPAETPAPEAPKVVTRTRRRSASRPAGEPVAAAEPAPVQIPVPETSAPATPAPEAPAVEAPAEVEPPKVVTRTRTRSSARRPAGPPAEAAPETGAAAAAATAPESAGESAGAGEESDADPSSIEHVPVKKKGTRKR